MNVSIQNGIDKIDNLFNCYEHMSTYHSFLKALLAEVYLYFGGEIQRTSCCGSSGKLESGWAILVG